MIDEATLDNCLVHQKDAIYAIINGKGDKAQRLERALERLDILKELWIAAGASYTGREIAERIRLRCRELDTCNVKRKERLERIFQRAMSLESEFWAAECLRNKAPSFMEYVNRSDLELAS